MSRTRLSYTLAFLGILITTGGCSNSATAPEAASVAGISASRARGDSVSTSNRPASDEGDITVQSGYVSIGN